MKAKNAKIVRNSNIIMSGLYFFHFLYNPGTKRELMNSPMTGITDRAAISDFPYPYGFRIYTKATPYPLYVP